jgi:hypothetical protein
LHRSAQRGTRSPGRKNPSCPAALCAMLFKERVELCPAALFTKDRGDHYV